MLIVKLMGGVGNQMFQYALARSIQEREGVTVGLDAEDLLDEVGPKYRLDQFQVTLSKVESSTGSLYKSKSLLGKLARRAGWGGFYKERERTVFDECALTSRKGYLWGYWQNEKYFRSIRSILLEEFQLSVSLGGAAASQLSRISSGDQPSVAIHVRRGDYLEFAEIGVLPMSYYMDAVSYVSSKFPGCRFFVFSNDIKWCREQFEWLEGCSFVSETESEIEDLYLMSCCQHNIIANSSFSWWSAWLNDYKDKLVVCPRQWMKENPNGYKWTPCDWVEL